MNDFTLIKISNPTGKIVEVVNNPTPYEHIGSGDEGAVFKLTDKKCVKIYPNVEHCRAEKEVLIEAQHSPLFPNLYDWGDNYIVIEYINGITLDKFLKNKNTIPFSLTKQFIDLYKEMERLKFTDVNLHMKHLIVTKDTSVA
ncbi:hypothetical protein [Alkalihalobacterium alkalinitrilicum]|uniref:hypothetical protein n=1 Tax=Alkalihalobacterium alkalinitrilicum TaxID=427920 RepID=UPI000995A4B5|nr:hypothetical protein [Alkalihalobacterium alkalinitrilicum]